ncbi:MAG: Phosphate transport system permease protein PstA [Dehalococcoidia bacterium]|nr:Phosphate transport system permease protein PstA [Dehalococcoidia bacterium]
MHRRRVEEAIFKGLMIASITIVAGSLLSIVAILAWKGLPALNIAMVTQTPKGGYYLGKEGGILNAIVGSLYLATGATVLAFIISLMVALFLQREYIGKTRFAGLVRLSLDILWGIPSIVYGAFGFAIMLYMGIRASLLGGIIVLTLLEIPILTRALDEVVRMIPKDLKEASYALGTTRLETSFKVVARQALPGIITAVLLAFGRGIGDAASILFTAGYTDRIPTSLFDPVASLPLAIFFQLGTPFPEVQARAYASAVILLVIILSISIVSRLLTKRLARNTVK